MAGSDIWNLLFNTMHLANAIKVSRKVRVKVSISNCSHPRTKTQSNELESKLSNRLDRKLKTADSVVFFYGSNNKKRTVYLIKNKRNEESNTGPKTAKKPVNPKLGKLRRENASPETIIKEKKVTPINTPTKELEDDKKQDTIKPVSNALDQSKWFSDFVAETFQKDEPDSGSDRSSSSGDIKLASGRRFTLPVIDDEDIENKYRKAIREKSYLEELDQEEFDQMREASKIPLEPEEKSDKKIFKYLQEGLAELSAATRKSSEGQESLAERLEATRKSSEGSD